MQNAITVQDLKTRLDQHETVQLIDVRSPGEYAAGHVPGALNIPLEQLAVRVEDLGSAPIAVLCQSGTRAGLACETLKTLSRPTLHVTGGTSAWIQAGYPVVASSSSSWALERQVRLGAGLMILIGTVLAVTVAPAWIYLAMFVGAGLTFAGATNICGMAILLAKLPWNRPAVACERKSA
jgi:rhodanese-related sulfurtransferase